MEETVWTAGQGTQCFPEVEEPRKMCSKQFMNAKLVYTTKHHLRGVHVWILLQMNVSVCIKDDQEVETIGHKMC